MPGDPLDVRRCSTLMMKKSSTEQSPTANEATPFDNGALYDIFFERFDFGLDFYLGLARAAGGPILDVAFNAERTSVVEAQYPVPVATTWARNSCFGLVGCAARMERMPASSISAPRAGPTMISTRVRLRLPLFKSTGRR